MPIEYANAPISELICGVIFKDNFLGSTGILFQLLSDLHDEYPLRNSQAPIFEEELQGVKTFTIVDHSHTGQSLFRLRSNDGRFMIQLQENFLLFNWFRSDRAEVGFYPGFNHIFEKFKKIFNLVESKLAIISSNADIYPHIKSFTLHYQDRISWQGYIENLSQINDIINLQIPKIESEGNSEIFWPNNIFSKYTIPIPSIHGYSIVSINTGVTPFEDQLLIVESRMKGKIEGENLTVWFNKAHKLQLSFFGTFFNRKILDKWKL